MTLIYSDAVLFQKGTYKIAILVLYLLIYDTRCDKFRVKLNSTNQLY